MVLTTRLKVLSALAVAVGVYILVSGPDQSAAPAVTAATRADRQAPTASAATRSAPRPAAADSGNLLARLAHRVSESKAVEALFHSQSWYVAPPPPPPAPVVVVTPPPPTAPPLPFSVMGSYARPGDAPYTS